MFDLQLVPLQATLCSKKSCLQALVAHLGSDSEELHQVVSSILRNLSWRADISSKKVLRDIGCVSAMMTCALQATKVHKPANTITYSIKSVFESDSLQKKLSLLSRSPR